jgi:hypothetical protein
MFDPRSLEGACVEKESDEPLDAAARHDLLEILEERDSRRTPRPLIDDHHQPIPVDEQHELIGDPTYAHAILDGDRGSRSDY